MFSYQLYAGQEKLLAICDSELLGRTFSGEEVEITVSEFYKGSRCGSKRAVEMARNATIINAVGSKIVKLLIKEKIVNEQAVIKIGDVPHAQVVGM